MNELCAYARPLRYLLQFRTNRHRLYRIRACNGYYRYSDGGYEVTEGRLHVLPL